MIHQFYLDQYERYVQRLSEAERRGDRREGRFAALKASEMMYKLAAASAPPLRDARKRRAAELLNKAEHFDEVVSPNKVQSSTAASHDSEKSSDEMADTVEWRVTDTGVSFDDIAGLDELKSLLKRRVIYPWLHPEVADRYQKKAGGGVMLYGPPGTGKTMLAKALATEIGGVFYSVRCSDLLSKWVGDAEKNMRRLFDALNEESSAVLFLDEAEALLQKRGGDAPVMNRLVPEFLQLVDGIRGKHEGLLMLGATNRPWDLDEAALRPGRFGELVYVPLPDEDARYAIIVSLLRQLPLAEDVNLRELAGDTEGMSGADLVGLCETIKDRPFEREIKTKQKQCVEVADLKDAVAATRPSVSQESLERYHAFASQQKSGA